MLPLLCSARVDPRGVHSAPPYRLPDDSVRRSGAALFVGTPAARGALGRRARQRLSDGHAGKTHQTALDPTAELHLFGRSPLLPVDPRRSIIARSGQPPSALGVSLGGFGARLLPGEVFDADDIADLYHVVLPTMLSAVRPNCFWNFFHVARSPRRTSRDGGFAGRTVVFRMWTAFLRGCAHSCRCC